MKKPLSNLYLLLILICLPSVYYWLGALDWNLNELTAFKVFPVLGLLAFNIMWFHLMVAWYKRYHPISYDYRSFFRQTSNLVLVLIIAHPLILFAKTLSLGIKPLEYVSPNAQPFMIFGGIALLVFLSYEVVDHVRDKPIVKNNWPIVVGLNRAAMILIFYHSLKLGSNLQSGPFKVLWIGFGLSLAAYFVSAYWSEIRKK